MQPVVGAVRFYAMEKHHRTSERHHLSIAKFMFAICLVLVAVPLVAGETPPLWIIALAVGTGAAVAASMLRGR